MTLNKIQLYHKQIEAIAPKIKPIGEQANESGQPGFGDFLGQAVNEVNKMQKQADTQIDNLIMQKPGATIHGTMMALEKADMAFSLMNQVRSKIIRAYEEVIRTQL